jgi:hypothetical protein
LKFRPLSSYLHHFWRNLLSITSRFATAAVKELNWGFGTTSPREVAHEVRGFAKSVKVQDLRISLWDIGDFFPNVDKGLLEFCINRAVFELTQKLPGVAYF